MEKASLKLPKGQIKEELIRPRPVFKKERFKSLLQQFGLKITSQRLSILKNLSSGSKTHLTAREIFEKVIKDEPDIGFATVYRFLKTISRLGIASELKMGQAPARYEIKSEVHHHHITCVHCGKIVEFKNEDMEKLILNIAKKHKFSLTQHIIELYGKCGRSSCPSAP